MVSPTHMQLASRPIDGMSPHYQPVRIHMYFLCICMYACMHACVYMCICVYVYMCICVYVYMCICVYVYMCICVYVYMCTCVHVYMCTCIHVYMYTCVYVYMYICIYVYMYLCIYVFMYICIYVHMYIHCNSTQLENWMAFRSFASGTALDHLIGLPIPLRPLRFYTLAPVHETLTSRSRDKPNYKHTGRLRRTRKGT